MLANRQTLEVHERALRFSTRSGLLVLSAIVLAIAWLVVGALLGFISIGSLLAGKEIGADRIILAFTLSGFLIPGALLIIACMVIQVVARVVWLTVSDGFSVILLSLCAIAGRLAVIFAMAYLWKR